MEGEGCRDQMDSEALKDQLRGMKFLDTPGLARQRRN